MFPDAAAANHAIFYKDGRAATVSEVYANLTRGGGAEAPMAPKQPDQGFLQYASARTVDRLEQQRALVDMVLRGPQDPGSDQGSLGGDLFSADMLRALTEARAERGRTS